MRTYLKLWLLLWPIVSFCQIKIDFETEDLTKWKQYPANRWDTSSVFPIEENHSLKHTFNNTESGKDAASYNLAGLSLEDTVTWRFSIRHGYNPSSSNNWIFFLMSGNEARDMSSGTADGYAVGINNSGNDDLLKLYKIQDGDITNLIGSGLNWENYFGASKAGYIEVIRAPKGTWTFKCGSSFDSLHFLGQATDTSFSSPVNMGICYKYSSSQDMKLWMDDIFITGTFVKDSMGPVMEDIRVLNSHEIKIKFSEPMLEPTNKNFYLTDSLSRPDSIIILSNKEIIVHFKNVFNEGILIRFHAVRLSDLNDNLLDIQEYGFTYHRIKKMDLLINEIMADPEPSLGLPACEYIEIFNRSDYPISLYNWNVRTGPSFKKLADVLIPAHGYLLFTTLAGAKVLSAFGQCVPAFSSLLNDGQIIELSDEENNVITSVQYDLTFYQNDLRSQGGWSIEQIDPSVKCQDANNWKASESSAGGTPGKINSVYKISSDKIAPYISQLQVMNDSLLIVNFSEIIDTSIHEYFTITPFLKYTSKAASERNADTLNMSNHIENGKMYTLSVKGFACDCSGNPLDQTIIPFALPLAPEQNDIIINEVLFNPKPGCPEFIEFFNKSDKIIDLGKLHLVIREATTENVLASVSPALPGTFVLPHQYIVLTSDSMTLKNYYTCKGKAIQIKNMHTLTDKKGIIELSGLAEISIDKLQYSEDMHSSFIKNSEGITLERVYDFQPSSIRENWHSASAESGYATPGYENSQHLSEELRISEISVEPEVFSPDNDGKEDYLTITYHFDTPGNVANITIFDAAGRSIKRIRTNELLGTAGFFNWDGFGDDHTQPPTGIYLVYVEISTPKAEVKKYKMPFVLGGRL